MNDEVKVLGIGRTQAYEAVRTAEIPSIRIGGRVPMPTAALKQMSGSGTDAA